MFLSLYKVFKSLMSTNCHLIIGPESHDVLMFVPNEEFELTANTLQAHMKPHGELILKPLIYPTVHS